MRKKIITVAATLLLLGLLSMVEQLSVERLTSEAMEKTQEILFLLAQNEPEQGLERARAMDAWWDDDYQPCGDGRRALYAVTAGRGAGDGRQRRRVRVCPRTGRKYRARFGAAGAVVAKLIVRKR